MGFMNSEIISPRFKDNTTRKRKLQVCCGGDGPTCRSWREPFRIFTTLLLSLLLPLSFLLLARLSAAHYLASVVNNNIKLHPQSFTTTAALVSFLFLHSTSTILYALVSLVSAAAFVHGLTAGRVTLLSISQPPEPIFRPRLYVAWVLVCTLQVCVGLGIEGSISAGIDGSGFGSESSLLSRVLLFVGLHETMLFWSKSVVKPVVDDTVMGFTSSTAASNSINKEEEERWAERVGRALSLGTLWWWRLRDEVDSLVVVAELMLAGQARNRVGVADLVGWWLYYLTVSIGTVRALKGVVWLGMNIVAAVPSRKVEKQSPDFVSSHPADNDDKV